MSTLIGPAYDAKDLAGFWRRTFALLIDATLLLFIYIVVSEYWYEVVPEEWITLEVAVWVEFGLFLFALAYCFLFRLTERGTLGYRIVGIRYAYMLMGKPRFMQRLYRAAITLLLIWGLFVVDPPLDSFR